MAENIAGTCRKKRVGYLRKSGSNGMNFSVSANFYGEK